MLRRLFVWCVARMFGYAIQSDLWIATQLKEAIVGKMACRVAAGVSPSDFDVSLVDIFWSGIEHNLEFRDQILILVEFEQIDKICRNL